MITKTKKTHNFFAGPAVMPQEALQRAYDEFFDFSGTGMSVMEISHRSKEFMAVNTEAQNLLRELLDIPDNYKILFLQGGASLQFGMLPMNFLGEGKTADYILTGGWSEKAMKEAKLFGTPKTAFTSKETNHNRIPKQEELKLDPKAEYVHITTNNTLYGTQWHFVPEVGNVPLVADMSSDMMWHKFDVKKYAMIYGGAQKNLGPSGVTVVIIREDFLAKCNSGLSTMLSYKTHAENDSLYNTPPTFGIYMLRNVLAWQKSIGGLNEVERRNRAKAKLIYDCIDKYPALYRGHSEKESRSLMNITFTMPTPELEEKFLAEAKALNMVGIKGHRSVGGCRASTYNALPLESARALADFMEEFAKKNA
ncbi:MAG TPA: 3-phosphoserine/phosphohydroxythreonine transaminase [Chroococcales cyanobacterium]